MHRHPVLHLLVMTAAFLPLQVLSKPEAPPVHQNGHVYVLSNLASGNTVLVFHRTALGHVRLVGSFATGGNGAGSGPDPLQSQNPVVLSPDGHLLFAVNAGSNSISAFRISGDQLTLLNTVTSGGTMPVSIAARDDLVYVLNAGGAPNISGFTVDPNTGELVQLPNSTQPLPGGAKAAPAEVAFVPGEKVLLVTEKLTDQIDTFVIDGNGAAQSGVAFASRRREPFGFAFGPDHVAVVSDAVDGKPGAAALSSYKPTPTGRLKVITPGIGDTQTAACWVAVTNDGSHAYTVNTASGTISLYSVSVGGQLALVNPTAASGNVPVDTALSRDSRFLYVRNGGDGTISGFFVRAGGSLKLIDFGRGLPDGAAGLAAD